MAAGTPASRATGYRFRTGAARSARPDCAVVFHRLARSSGAPARAGGSPPAGLDSAGDARRCRACAGSALPGDRHFVTGTTVTGLRAPARRRLDPGCGGTAGPLRDLARWRGLDERRGHSVGAPAALDVGVA